MRIAVTGEETLIYLHVPKAAGSTMISILERNVPPDRRFAVDGRDIQGSKKYLAGLSPAERAGIQLLYGHLSYGWHELVPGPARYFTIVRHPVDRVVSHYNYVRFRADGDHYLREEVVKKDMSLGEYVASGVCDEVNDGQVRLLSGVEDIVQEPYGLSRIPYGGDHSDLLEMALDHIESDFVFVGLQERFDESLRLLQRSVGLRRVEYRPLNIGRKKWHGVTPDAGEIEVIRHYNAADLELYRVLRERFENEAGRLQPLLGRSNRGLRNAIAKQRVREKIRDALDPETSRIQGALSLIRIAAIRPRLIGTRMYAGAWTRLLSGDRETGTESR